VLAGVRRDGGLCAWWRQVYGSSTWCLLILVSLTPRHIYPAPFLCELYGGWVNLLSPAPHYLQPHHKTRLYVYTRRAQAPPFPGARVAAMRWMARVRPPTVDCLTLAREPPTSEQCLAAWDLLTRRRWHSLVRQGGRKGGSSRGLFVPDSCRHPITWAPTHI
jgi:hypothetical protein